MKDCPAMKLVRQRDDLVARIASERDELRQCGTSIRPLVKWVGGLNGAIRFLGNNSEYLLLPAAIMTMSKPRRLLAIAISGLGLWRLARTWRR
jgi:hypothetical protein